MAANQLDDRTLLAYLVGVFTLSTVAILLLGTLYLTRVPSFTLALVDNPVHAMWTDPVAVGLVLATLFSILSLVGLVVGFGATYGLAETDQREYTDERE